MLLTGLNIHPVKSMAIRPVASADVLFAGLATDRNEPFAEDHWTSVVIGDVRFRVAKPTDRCVMTTIDPESLETGKEPIRTLARHRLFDHKTMFAIHLIPETTGGISVGDSVEVS